MFQSHPGHPANMRKNKHPGLPGHPGQLDSAQSHLKMAARTPSAGNKPQGGSAVHQFGGGSSAPHLTAKKTGNFDRLAAKLAQQGAKNPGGLAAYIGNRKYGKGQMQAKARRLRRGR